MNALTADRFAEFFKSVYERDPFPWQGRLAKRVCAPGGEWPRAIALPTAAGKTGCIDIAVFALACQAELKDRRTAPRRIFFVVDRRVVVDQAYLHAEALANRLREPRTDIEEEVGGALRRLADDVRPLDVYALRGGMYREDTWVRSPLQPTVITSTVDQVGSRMLFRGYGVSDSMKPIHAGLVANDSLILLDEAHCANPLAQTAEAVAKYREWTDPDGLRLPPFAFVQMTATPAGDVAQAEARRKAERPKSPPLVFELDFDPDGPDFRGDSGKKLRARVTAAKPTRLVIADKPKRGEADRAPLVRKLVEEARRLMADGFKAVGVMVNRVATAREIAASLTSESARVILLTGRMRPLDRDQILRDLDPLFAGKSGEVPPMFVVATQTLEVGADLDFHALVTECASLDALRQRFGRLNRIAARTTAKGVIVVRADQVDPDASDPDPVYGPSLVETWNWLRGESTREEIDLGVAALDAVLRLTDPQTRAKLSKRPEPAPVLLPAYLDCWVQTGPRPTPDPDPAFFLHGRDRPGVPDVKVVFRADLGDDPETWAEVVSLCPPSSSEALPVRIDVFRRWLAQDDTADDSGDVEGGGDRTSKVPDRGGRQAVRWCGPRDKRTGPIDPNRPDIRPGDTFVLPADSEGIHLLGDFPEVGEHAGRPLDYGDAGFQRSRDRAILRLTPAVIAQWPAAIRQTIAGPLGAEVLQLEADQPAGALEKPLVELVKLHEEDERAADEQLDAVLTALAGADSPDWLHRAATELAVRARRTVQRHPAGGLVVVGRWRLRQFDPTFADEESAESPCRREVTLEHHTGDVVHYARRFAGGCGLPPELVDRLTRAAYRHDLGKADPRFQAMLRGSSPRTAAGFKDLLAKSGAAGGPWQDRERAREVHRYPNGARHEMLSVAFLPADADDLELYLMAGHHGYARPFAPPVEDDTAGEIRGLLRKPVRLFEESFRWPEPLGDPAVLNAAVPERFWRVVRRFGWWGSAYLDALFRLADHAASRAEQEETWKPVLQQQGLPMAADTRRVDRPATHTLELTGLDGSNPLAFLAAIGVLRLAERLYFPTRMKWVLSGRWVPVLEVPSDVDRNRLLDGLHGTVHRAGYSAAVEKADALYGQYRERLKAVEQALKRLRERKLRGAERLAAEREEVDPIRREAEVARGQWLQALEANVPAVFLSLGRSLSVTADEFRRFATQIVGQIHLPPRDRQDGDFAAAFGCEACTTENGRIVPTEFQLITGSGHQFFLETLGTLMEVVSREQLERALFAHPWPCQDPRLSFRWNPADDRRYAYAWDDPSGEEVRTEHGANLLAAMGLPFFPLIPAARGAATTGFDSRTEPVAFTWPVWENPLTSDAARSLLAIGKLVAQQPDRDLLRCLGIVEVLRARKIEVGRPPLSKLNLSAAVTV
jgi:CRISPR-associated endonuclease/helicase Cas3